MDETEVTHDKPTDEDASHEPAHDDRPARRHGWKTPLIVIAALLATAAALTGAYVGYVYAVTPVSIREPLLEHYHFRMQILVNGKAENFADSRYQEGYAKDNCNAGLTQHPFHFHDKKDQFAHVHWEGVSGGQLLKYYGWNFIGGTRGALGYRFDEAPNLKKVPIHGNVLPAIPDDAKFYVYVRDGSGYKEKQFSDFTSQDLEQFFGKTSNFPAHKLNQSKRSFLRQLQDRLVPTASAHDGEVHVTGTADEAELTRINNLLGDVIIFVQKDKPTDAKIKDRFNRLEPLTESSCGG